MIREPRQLLGVIVLAVMKSNGTMKFNPAGDSVIEAGDVSIAMGERNQLTRLENLLQDDGDG